MATRHYPVIQQLRERLDAYRVGFSPTLTNKALARKLGVGPTQVSKYLNDKCDWDVTAFELKVEDVLKAAELRRDIADHTLLTTSVTRQVNSVCETIQKTNDIGLIFGPAGAGKTVAIAMYVDSNSSAIDVTLTRWRCNSHGLEKLIFEAMETRAFSKSKLTRAEWIIGRLRNSDRILILDNAHRMTKSGLEWIFDFHDATGVPIALVGNPEILDKIRDNDQQFSRIGIVREVTLKDAAKVAAKIIDQLAPGTQDEIGDLATTIAGEQGHLRTLKKHLLLIPELRPACGGDPRKALLAAHTQLVSDYKLT